MKVIAYYPIHYGATWLEASIQSIYDHVDKIVFLYAPYPSFGFESNIPCPETEEQLKAIALQFDKVQWVNVGRVHSEEEHRGLAYRYTSGYDLLLAVDSDEVWLPESLKECLEIAAKGEYGRYNILGFIHFWRSLNYIVADSFAPGRIYNLHKPPTSELSIWGKVYHMGYAQPEEIIRYKLSIHGHKSEIRSEWLDLFVNWTPETTDLHPTSYGVWPQAMPFSRYQLPKILRDHPKFHETQI